MQASTGKYIGYIDSDDFVPLNYFESLMTTMHQENAEVVICDINVINEFDNTAKRNICGYKNAEKISFVNTGLAASACNKLFARKNIQEYEFQVGKVNEDIAVVIPTVIHASKVAYNSEVFYNYVQRNNSIQNSPISEKRFDIFYGVNQTLERIANCRNFDEYKDAIVYQQLIVLFLYILPKVPTLLKRAKFFKKFHLLSKKYNIRANRYLEEDFYKYQNKKHRLYYKTLLFLNCSGFSFLSSVLVQSYILYMKGKKHQGSSVIQEEITLDKLISLCQCQKKLKQNRISISVVIPNYNYEKFLFQRLYSILYQKIKINEVILLDDFSTDNSRELIDKIVNSLEPYINIRKYYNDKNSGSAFKQWEKGMSLAKSDYVWIAEADDYCNKNMLKKLIRPIKKNNNIMISYCDTAFINAEGNVFIKSIVPEIDIMKTKHWRRSYINTGKNEFDNFSFLNNTIANVSSCLIKNINYDKEFQLSGKYKQAGDWLFYVSVMQKGYISYYNKPLNYYRVHGNNVSSVTKKQDHLNELKRIYKLYDDTYGLNEMQKKEIEKRLNFLLKAWELI